MEVTMRGAVALKRLRQELQENAEEDFPNGIHRELLVLYDVCKCLDLNIFEAKDVLGEFGWRYVTRQISSPVCTTFNQTRVQDLIGLPVDL